MTHPITLRILKVINHYITRTISSIMVNLDIKEHVARYHINKLVDEGLIFVNGTSCGYGYGSGARIYGLTTKGKEYLANLR